MSQIGGPIAQGAGTGAAVPVDCNSARRSGRLRRQKLVQNMLVVGDYFAEQARVSLSNEVVERWQVILVEAASFASAHVTCAI